MLPYHQMIKDYTNIEGRDLWEYELNLTPAEVQRMMWHLLEIEGTYADYYFLSDNCSFALLQLLEVARPGLWLAKDSELYVIPSDSIKRIQTIVSKVTHRKSLKTTWLEKRRTLNFSEKVAIRQSEPAEHSGKTLEAAQLYWSLQQSAGDQEAKQKSYLLAKERAKRPQLLADNADAPFNSWFGGCSSRGYSTKRFLAQLLFSFRFS
jgi:hypothetical protein